LELRNNLKCAMGNKTNDRTWAAAERLRFIETCAWWKGVVQRQDLGDLFGISMAQASSDLQRYLELNLAAFVYNLRQKRYEATAEMQCVLTKPRLDEAVTRFLGGDARSTWPGWDEELAADEVVTVVVQVNGKLRDRLQVAVDADKDAVLAEAKAAGNTAKFLEGKQVVKEIYVPGKLVNFVVR